MKTILITGATGFVGSSLSMEFLRKKNRVIALSRNDLGGARTRQAVRAAANGFEVSPATINWDLLDVIDVDYCNLPALLKDENFNAVDEVWHCAAEMTYNPKKLEKAIQQNLTNTFQLYKIIAENTKCRRFYHVSTAYTAGVQTLTASEDLHLDPVLINPYQVSKWGAEMTLSRAAEVYGLPVSIFRPSVVVGHEHTGWHGGSQFGFYSFLNGLCFAKYLWTENIQVDLNPAGEANLIPVDYLCQQALQLSERPAESTAEPTVEPTSVEIFHCVAKKSLKIDQFAQLINEELGLKIQLSPPANRISQILQRKIEKNSTFANLKIDFSTTKIRAAIGEDYTEFHMNSVIIRHMIQKYLQSYKNSRRHLAHLDALKAQFTRMTHVKEKMWNLLIS